MRTEELGQAAASWRASLESMLSVAEQIGPMDELLGDMSVDGATDEAQLEELADSRVRAVLEDSDRIVSLLRPDLESDTGARGQLLLALVGNISAADALVQASERSVDFFGDFGVDAEPASVLEPVRTDLDRLALAVAGRSPIRGGQAAFPTALTDRFEALEDAAGTELTELAKSDTVWALGAGAVGSMATILNSVPAFDIVRAAITGFAKSLKRAATSIIKWVVEQALTLIPEALRGTIDTAWSQLHDKLVVQLPTQVGNLTGRLLGRPKAETAWRTAVEDGRDLVGAEAGLPTVVDDCVARIGWITTGRERIDTLSSKVVGAASTAGPAIQTALGAALLAVFAFVALQVWDGCNDIERLLPTT